MSPWRCSRPMPSPTAAAPHSSNRPNFNPLPVIPVRHRPPPPINPARQIRRQIRLTLCPLPDRLHQVPCQIITMRTIGVRLIRLIGKIKLIKNILNNFSEPHQQPSNGCSTISSKQTASHYLERACTITISFTRSKTPKNRSMPPHLASWSGPFLPG